MTPRAEGEKKKRKKKKKEMLSQILSSIHMWYSNDIKREQVNGERHILVFMRKQLSDFNNNGVLKEISMFRRVYLKPITALTFPAYKITRLN